MREGESQMLGTFILPHRQSHLEWPARKVKDFIEWMGLQKVVVRSDQEEAMKSLVENVRQLGIGVLVEHSPKYEKQCNGRAEQSVQQLEGMIRALKLVLEARVKKRIPTDHPIISHLAEHAAFLCYQSIGQYPCLLLDPTRRCD